MKYFTLSMIALVSLTSCSYFAHQYTKEKTLVHGEKKICGKHFCAELSHHEAIYHVKIMNKKTSAIDNDAIKLTLFCDKTNNVSDRPIHLRDIERHREPIHPVKTPTHWEFSGESIVDDRCELHALVNDHNDYEEFCFHTGINHTPDSF